jgi:sialidase-1
MKQSNISRPEPYEVIRRRNRRHFLQTAGIAAASMCFRSLARASTQPHARVESIRVISQQQQYYHGWPTLVRRRNGELLVTYSGGREAHVCPFGRVELIRSKDNGETWSWPQILLDGPIDDRDSGVVETNLGSILVTTFTSLAYEPLLEQANRQTSGNAQAWPKDKLSRWNAARDRISSEQREKELGVWMVRSTDGGVTWSARYGCQVNSPHGPVQLSDGRLLYAGKDLWGTSRVGICESKDDGQTWQWLAEIPAREGDTTQNYHELHAVEAADGRIVVHIRNHNTANERETLQIHSSDGGKTWSAPQPIGVWGLPSHLLRLKDGRLLMSYGHRRVPFGNQARLSDDHGRTWSGAIVISDDGASGDLGYPSTVQLDDSSFVTVWYELQKGSSAAVLRQARWSID